MRVPLLAAALVAAMVTTTLPATAVTANDDADTVRFALTKVTGPSSDRRFTAQLRCDDTTAARATLVHPKQSVQVRAHAAATRTCTVELRAEAVPGRTDEVTYTIRQDDRVLARRVAYARNGRSVSSDFIAPHGEVQVDIEVASLARDRVGVPVRAMAFNIWRSGTLDAHPDGEQNLAELIEFVRSEDPDILFMVETYGSGEKIVDGLNKGLPRERRYTGVRITREPDQTPTEDNLWLFTRFPVEKVYPRLGEGDLTSFNFGGARLRLPNGERLHAFPTWLHHTDGATNLTNQSALEEVLGLGRTYTDQQIVDTDKRRRIGMATTLLEERLPGYLAQDESYAEAPVLLAGDFNTLSHLDWSARFANAPGHAGLVLDWPVTRMFTQAGFTDTYRWANPDAGRYPGRTWSPVNGFGYAPQRIDYILARGEDIRVLSSHTRARRLPHHRGSDIDQIYPFYSDHGAVVTDLLIRGKGTGPKRAPVTDAPEPPEAGWPEPPAGRPVPAAELTATASTEQTGGEAARAVDGDLRTHWHSRYSPEVDPQPHDITIDMQRERALSAVRYQPRVVGNMNGTLLRVVVQASSDGSAWEDVTTVTWERTTLPKDVDLTGVTARYLRFHVELGIGGFSSAAEITPYEPE